MTYPFKPLIIFWYTILRHGGFSISKTPLVLLYSIRLIVFEPLRWCELLFFSKKINRQSVQPPVFILGYWRSGTMFLYSLLRHHQNHTSLDIFGVLFTDILLMTRRWLKPLIQAYLRIVNHHYAIQRSRLDLSLPAELDVGLYVMSNPHSYSWGHVFPRHFQSWINRCIIRSDVNNQWVNGYKYLIRKLTYASGGKRVIVKSPGDTGRVGALIRAFPNAKFVYVHRDPLKVYHSNVYLWKVIQNEFSLQKISQEQIHSHILTSYKQLIQAYEKQKSLVPPDQLITINFQDLVQYPEKELAKIYEHLQLGQVPEKEIQAIIDLYATQKANWTITPELKQELEKEWDFAFRNDQ